MLTLKLVNFGPFLKMTRGEPRKAPRSLVGDRNRQKLFGGGEFGLLAVF